MKKGLKKFMIVCGIVAGIGAVCTVTGFAMGGFNSIDKVSDKYSWFETGEREMKCYEDYSEIESLKIDTYYNVRISSGDKDCIKVCYEDKRTTPDISNVNGRVTIAQPDDENDVSIDLSHSDQGPYIEIICDKDKKLSLLDLDVENEDISISDIAAGSIMIDSEFGNVSMTNVSFDNGDIGIEDGDLVCKSVKSHGLKVESDCGNCNMSGEFAGINEIEVEDGDLNMDTSLSEKMYSVIAEAESGSISIGKTKFDSYNGRYSTGYGPNKLKLHSENGNITVKYGKSEKVTSDTKNKAVQHNGHDTMDHDDDYYDD
ncbi:MAG: DUF4097 family beta strand repeat-containing protein [Bacillota bacterium]|nr:DUF4097 family beta strand repeat-containing protein [Bacillota bacterium]